jgi:hypothetical protein
MEFFVVSFVMAIGRLWRWHRLGWGWLCGFSIQTVLYQAGYIERFGTGTRELFRLTKEAGLKEPEFDFTGGFYITIWSPPAYNHPTSTPPVPYQHRNSTATIQDTRHFEFSLFILLRIIISPAICGGFIEGAVFL